MVKKIFLVFIGILISFIIIEFSLRVGGYFFQLQAIKGEATKKINIVIEDSLRILCVGDSFTFGAGAKNGYSYPEQLQRLLDGGKLKYTVYNLGVPATNSSIVLLKLPGWIELYKPRMVVLLIGANDRWNFENSKYYFFQKGRGIYLYRLENCLLKLKTYKLLKLLMMNMDKLVSGGKKYPLNFTAARRPNPDVEGQLKLAFEYFDRDRNFDKVKEMAEKVLISDPENDRAILLLGWIYLDSDKTELAELNLKKAIQINPNNMEAHKQLFRLYRHINKNELAKEELEIMLKFSPENEELKTLKKFGIPCAKDEELLFRQLKYNLKQIIDLLRSKRIALILQTYPCRESNAWFREIARDYNIPLVDQESAFKGLNYKDYSVSDGHPNERGYSIMAKGLFELIKKINDKTGSRL